MSKTFLDLRDIYVSDTKIGWWQVSSVTDQALNHQAQTLIWLGSEQCGHRRKLSDNQMSKSHDWVLNTECWVLSTELWVLSTMWTSNRKTDRSVMSELAIQIGNSLIDSI